MRTFRAISGTFPGHFQDNSGKLPGNVKKILGNFPGNFRENFREKSGIVLEHCGNFLEIFRGNFLGKSVYFKFVVDSYNLQAGHLAPRPPAAATARRPYARRANPGTLEPWFVTASDGAPSIELDDGTTDRVAPCETVANAFRVPSGTGKAKKPIEQATFL